MELARRAVHLRAAERRAVANGTQAANRDAERRVLPGLGRRTARFDGPRKVSADLDSVLILRVTRASGVVDTIAKTRPQPTQVETEGQPGEAPKSITLRFTMLGVAKEAVAEHERWLKSRFSDREVEQLIEMLARIHE